MHYYVHPESSCYFTAEYPLGMDSVDACLCEEITKEQYQKGLAMTARAPVTIEAVAARIEVGDETQAPAAEATAAEIVSDERLVATYIRIREAKSAFVKAHEAKLEETYEAPLRTISAALKARLQDRGNEGLKTTYGTVYLAETLKVTCQDWGVFHQWIKEHDALDFFEQRVKAGEVKKFMEEHNGDLPPGLSVFRELEARVRKPTKRGEAAVGPTE